ncbi:MAG: ATP-binding response regulator [Janthinobacterium lividum]
MTSLHRLIGNFARRRPPAQQRYGVTLLLVAAMTFMRSLAPDYIAPFLLYIPVLLAVSLAFGWSAGTLTLGVSTAIAAWFYLQDGRLSGIEVSLLVQYVAVAAVMVWICHSLRHSIILNEVTLERVNDSNQVLVENQAALSEANATAEAAKAFAEQANLAKSAFIANMSHELRTPLSAIIGYSEMMTEEIEDGGDVADFGADMRKIEGNARHLLGLINDVLDLSKVESGKMDVYPEAFDLEPIVREVATTAHTLVEKKGNRLDVQIAPGIGRMVSDLTKVRQILLNLLSNAAKFTENGTVTLSVSRLAASDGERVVFSVEDTGIGMTEEQISRLFQRFVQADVSTTRKYGGTGLGLSLTKALSEILGGDITVESIAGRGTTFTVAVLANLHAEAAAVAQEPEDLGAQGSDLVLVVDDDADQRALMAKFLHREGFKVRTAPDGRTGLTLARQLRPHAILLDVMMPGIDGWSVLSALKADADLTDIPVIMVTFVEQRALATSLGASDYVMKPVKWDRFKHVMDRYRPPENAVLIIDDDADTRARIRKVMERDGWAVDEAENGQDGLAKLAEAKPGIILLDLTMPVMDGFAFLEAMRAKIEYADIPVVVLTALDLTWQDRRRLHGASQILHKGDVSMRALAERLQSLATHEEQTDVRSA